MTGQTVQIEAKRQRNQRGEGSRLREELMHAAMRILDSAPGSQLSLRMVAREAGIAAPSVYAHFPDARTMMTEIVRECWRQVGDEMASAAQNSSPAEPLVLLKNKMKAFVDYAMATPSRYQLLFALYPIASEEQYQMQGHLRPAYRQVLESVADIGATGRLLPLADAENTTLLLISLAHGRIALAHLAPNRHGNTAKGIKSFVLNTIDRLFA